MAKINQSLEDVEQTFSQIVNVLPTAQVPVKLYLYVNWQISHALFFFNDRVLWSYCHFEFLDFYYAINEEIFGIDNW